MKIVIATEGEEFNPGIILGRGALTWPETIPLTYGYNHHIFGKVTNIRREGDDIVGDFEDAEFSAAINRITKTSDEDGVDTITGGTLRGVGVVPVPAKRAK